MSQYDKYAKEAETMTMPEHEWWKPEDGESITGRVHWIGETEGFHPGTTQRVIKIDTGVKMFSRQMNAVLERLVEELRIVPDMVITLKYFGKGNTKKGNEYNRYDIKVHEKPEEKIPF